VDRLGGLLYNQTWSAAPREKPAWTYITTFNDWNEGHAIEPSIQFGRQYLYSIAYFAAKFKEGDANYDGLTVPLAIYNATVTIGRAPAQGRMAGLDEALSVLAQAKGAFESRNCADAFTLADQAKQLARQAPVPEVTQSSTANSLTTMTPLQTSFGTDRMVVLVAAAISTVLLLAYHFRKRKR